MDIKEYVDINIDIKTLNKDLYELLELTHTHITILYYVYISKNKQIDLSEVVKQMETNTSILNKQIKQLQSLNYITKYRYEDNMRKVYLAMSEEQVINTKALLDLVEDYLQKLK